MYKIFNRQPEEEPEPIPQTDKAARLMATVNLFRSSLPPLVATMLSGILPRFSANITDEQIDAFAAKTRGYIDYIENGGEMPDAGGDLFDETE